MPKEVAARPAGSNRPGKARKKRKHRYSGIGGQAVLEGVMMKNKDTYAVAVRKPDGEIAIETKEYKGILPGSPLKRIPFIRGTFNFIDSMVLGMSALSYSASFFDEDEAPKDGGGTETDISSGTGNGAEAEGEQLKDKGKGSDLANNVFMGITMVISMAVAIGIFMVLPYFLAQALQRFIRNQALLSLSEGIIRILLFLIYVVGISCMKDIYRLYQYHGAEHKCINCVERGLPLTVENAMRCSRQHKRCGTSFLLFVMLVSVILFFFIRIENPVYRVLIRIALIPVISGISYELIRLAGRTDFFLIRLLSAPGLALQRLTTKEPDAEMVAVAIRSVEAVFDWRQYLEDSFDHVLDPSWYEEGEQNSIKKKAPVKDKTRRMPVIDDSMLSGKTGRMPRIDDTVTSGKTGRMPRIDDAVASGKTGRMPRIDDTVASGKTGRMPRIDDTVASGKTGRMPRMDDSMLKKDGRR